MLAVDWSGDPGIASKRPGPPYLALAVVAYDDEGALGQVLDDFRRAHRLAPHHEFHYVAEKPDIRQRFIATVAQAPIEARVAVVDKARAATDPSWTLGKGDELLRQLILTCTAQLPRSRVEKAVMVIDGNKGSTTFCTTVRKLLSRTLPVSEFRCGPQKVRPLRSKRTPGIMVADMIAGTARHAHLHRQPEYLQPLKHRARVFLLP